MKTIAALIGTLLAVNAYAAETYNVEAGVQYLKNSTDDGTNLSAYTLGANYYFQNILIDGTQPFMELDVLQRANNVRVGYSVGSLETSVFPQNHIQSPPIIWHFLR